MIAILDIQGNFMFNLAATSSADLHEIDFRNASLQALDFSNSQLKGCNFNGANLTGSNFTNSVLFHCTFQSALIHLVNFIGADLRQADFRNATDILIGGFTGIIQNIQNGQPFNTVNWNGANIFAALFDAIMQKNSAITAGAVSVPGPRPLPLNL